MKKLFTGIAFFRDDGVTHRPFAEIVNDFNTIREHAYNRGAHVADSFWADPTNDELEISHNARGLVYHILPGGCLIEIPDFEAELQMGVNACASAENSCSPIPADTKPQLKNGLLGAFISNLPAGVPAKHRSKAIRNTLAEWAEANGAISVEPLFMEAQVAAEAAEREGEKDGARTLREIADIIQALLEGRP